MVGKAGFEPATSASRSQFWRILANPPEQIYQLKTSAWTLVNGTERSGARVFRGFASCRAWRLERQLRGKNCELLKLAPSAAAVAREESLDALLGPTSVSSAYGAPPSPSILDRPRRRMSNESVFGNKVTSPVASLEQYLGRPVQFELSEIRFQQGSDGPCLLDFCRCSF